MLLLFFWSLFGCVEVYEVLDLGDGRTDGGEDDGIDRVEDVVTDFLSLNLFPRKKKGGYLSTKRV